MINYGMPRDICPLKSEAELDAALTEIERYFADEPRPGTREGDRFDRLARVIAA